MRKILSIVLLTVIFVLAGCKGSDERTEEDVKAIMLKSCSNENVQVDFKTTSNLTLISESTDEFEIYQYYGKEDEKKYVHTALIELKMYEKYISQLEEEEACTIIEKGTKDNVEYVYYKHQKDDKIQYNRICHIIDTDTYMMIYCYDNKDVADEVFTNLSFTVK